MQVKRRINQFFGNILRKDKGQQLENEEEPESSSPTKNKQKNKSNQSYSQWDLIEHIAGEPVEDESTRGRKPLADNTVYSDGLAYFTEESTEDISDIQLQMSMIDGDCRKKPKSFLKRSGSLLRRSLRRSKKKAKQEGNEAALKWDGIEQENLSSVVQEINTTLLAVATFPTDNDYRPNVSSDNAQSINEANESSFEIFPPSSTYVVSCIETEKVYGENESPSMENWVECEKWNQQEKKGLKNGLKRQASKLASKFQRTSGSVRLKSTASMDSFPTANRNRSMSVCTNTMVGNAAPDLTDSKTQKRAGSFKRKLSFKAARKVVRNGAASFGKSMMHASAVMPMAYESPPITFYPDYENENDLPPHLVQCYYRTLSYQPKDCHSSNDKVGHQTYQNYARPTAFYQHGYCYNG